MAKAKIRNYPIGPFPTVIAGAEVEGRPNFTTAGASGCVCLAAVVHSTVGMTFASATLLTSFPSRA